MFVTKKAQPNKFDILLNVRQLDRLVTYQFDNISFDNFAFGNLEFDIASLYLKYKCRLY
jgi:hypothetical protein